MGGLRIDARPAWGVPNDVLGRAEGVAISHCGRMIAVAQAEHDRVALFEREPRGTGFAGRAAGTIGGPASGVDYPHDVDFSPDGRLLAVANRRSATVTLYRREPGAAVRFGERPVWTIARRRLEYTDGVKFVPPDGRYLAAANLARDSVTFFRRGLLRRARFGPKPCFVLVGPETGIDEPDGLAFSPDGRLLAVTNHGAHTVTVYARSGRRMRYGPAPVAVLGRSSYRLRYPHSVAFSPSGSHLAVSNAGGRAVAVYRHAPAGDGRDAWSDAPVLELEACDPRRFDGRNQENRQEGGSKGVAFGSDCFAVCNEHFGLRVHRVAPAGDEA